MSLHCQGCHGGDSSTAVFNRNPRSFKELLLPGGGGSRLEMVGRPSRNLGEWHHYQVGRQRQMLQYPESCVFKAQRVSGVSCFHEIDGSFLSKIAFEVEDVTKAI